MKEEATETKTEVHHAADLVAYQPGAVVSRIVLKRETGNVTLFAFDAGQEDQRAEPRPHAALIRGPPRKSQRTPGFSSQKFDTYRSGWLS